MMGRYADARSAFQHALDQLSPADPIARADLQRKLGNCWRELHHFSEALDEYDLAVLELGAEPNLAQRQTHIEIEFERFSVHYWLANVQAIHDTVERLRPLVEQHATPPQRARLYQILAIATLRLGRYVASDEAVGSARSFLTMVQAAGDSIWLQSAHFQLGFSLLWHGDLNEAEREMLAAWDLAQARGDISLQARCLTYLTVVQRMRGDLEKARAYAQQSLQLAAHAQMYDYVGAAHGNLAWLAWHHNEPKQTLAEGQLALDAWQRLPNVYMFQWVALLPLIAASLHVGDLPQALTFAARLLDESQQRLPDALDTLFTRALQASNDGDLPAAHALLEQSLLPARELNYL
jgi:hypothetical protein